MATRHGFAQFGGFGRGALASLTVLSAAPGPRPRAALPPIRADVGRIEGVAKVAKVLTTIRQHIRVYDEPGTPPPKPITDDNPLANVVIYLESAATLQSATPAATTHLPAALHQRDEMFSPHVLPILVGTTVEFPNDDALFHDVFSLSSTKTFDLQRYPQGTSRHVTFNRPGVVEVFCHIHADMSAYILVLDNPFFVIPDAQGHFALDGVPPGNYRLVAWYERTRPVIVPVTVVAGQTRNVPVLIPIADPVTH